MSEQMQLAHSTPQPSFWFMPHSWTTSPHPDARIHKPLFQSPHSINRNPQHTPVELPSAGMTLGLYLSVGRNTSLWMGHLVLPLVVLIVATHTRLSRLGCTSSTTAILQAWDGRLLSFTKVTLPGCRFGW